MSETDHNFNRIDSELRQIEVYINDRDELYKMVHSQLSECLDAIVYYRKGSRGANPLTAGSWFLHILKRHGRVKPVEGEDLDAFQRPEV